jgi:hypothetical protein
MENNDIFTSLYKKRFNEIDENPTNDVWENISNELDVNDMWSKIDTKLTSSEKRKSNSRKLIWSLSFLILLITSASIYFYNNSLLINNPKHTPITLSKADNKQIVFKEKESVKNSNIELKNLNNQNTIQQKNILNKEILITKFDTTTKVNYTELTNNIDEKHNIELLINNSTTKNNVVLNDSVLKLDTLNNINKEVILINFDSNRLTTIKLDSNKVSLSNKKSQFTGVYFGGVYSFNNTWLLNNSTFDGFNSNSLNQTNISFNNTFGIVVGYNYNENWGAELSGYYNSPQSQTYYLYSEGKYQKKEVNLNYTIFSFAVKQRNISNNNWLNVPSSNNIILGFNYGILNQAKEVIGTNTSQLDSYFQKNDYGFRLGYEYEILLVDRILVSMGIFSDTGLRNIFKGSDSKPSNFNRTHTEALRLNLGVKYLIK